MRLIDADALKGQIRETIKVYKTNGEFDEPLKRFCNMLRQEIKAIDNAPTIEPVKHGKWTVDEKHTEEIYTNPVYCSVCGKDVVMDYGEYAPYCPNCGAKMKG